MDLEQFKKQQSYMQDADEALAKRPDVHFNPFNLKPDAPNLWWAESSWFMGAWLGVHIPTLEKSMNKTARRELQKTDPNLCRALNGFGC